MDGLEEITHALLRLEERLQDIIVIIFINFFNKYLSIEYMAGTVLATRDTIVNNAHTAVIEFIFLNQKRWTNNRK